MPPAAFPAAILALLFAPGPTNTLLAAYALAILALAHLGGPLLHRWPPAATAIKLAAPTWVLLLAARLWRSATNPAETPVTPARVLITTLLNPKSLVIALALLPAPGQPAFALRFTLTLLAAALAGLAWTAAGTLAPGRHSARVRTAEKAASLWLALVSGLLVAGAFSA